MEFRDREILWLYVRIIPHSFPASPKYAIIVRSMFVVCSKKGSDAQIPLLQRMDCSLQSQTRLQEKNRFHYGKIHSGFSFRFLLTRFTRLLRIFTTQNVNDEIKEGHGQEKG